MGWFEALDSAAFGYVVGPQNPPRIVMFLMRKAMACRNVGQCGVPQFEETPGHVESIGGCGPFLDKATFPSISSKCQVSRGNQP